MPAPCLTRRWNRPAANYRLTPRRLAALAAQRLIVRGTEGWCVHQMKRMSRTRRPGPYGSGPRSRGREA